MKVSTYLQRARAHLIRGYCVAILDGQVELAREIEVTLHQLRVRAYFPRTRLHLLAPGASPEIAAEALLRLLIDRVKRRTPARGAGVTRARA